MRDISKAITKPDCVVRLEGNRIVKTPVSKWPKAQDEWVYMLSQSRYPEDGRVFTVVTAWDGHNGQLICRFEVKEEHYTFTKGTRLAKNIIRILMEEREKAHGHGQVV